MQQAPYALSANEQSNESHQRGAGIRHFSGQLVQTAKTFPRVLDRQRCQRTHRYKRYCQAQAKRQYQRKTEDESFQLQTDQKHRESRRARQQSAREAEHNELAGRDVAIGETFLPLLRVRTLMIVFALELLMGMILWARMTMAMRMLRVV